MISVVIPVYNGARFLKETFRMLDESEERDLEFVFVDDGSTDQSGEIIRKLAEKDARVCYYKKENGGIASARNFGLEKAKGEYVCFLDQDDLISKDMFSIMLADAQNTGADMVQAGTTWVIKGVPEKSETSQKINVLDKGTLEYQYHLQSLVMQDMSPHPECKMVGAIWSCIFKTAFLRENEITFYCFCDYEDDWIFCIQAFLAAKRVCLESKIVYGWRVHEQSESHNRTINDRYLDNFYQNHQRMRAFFWKALEEAGLTEQEKARYAIELQKQAILWSLSNETGRGIQKHTIKESTAIMKKVMKEEKSRGICKDLNKYALSISSFKASGWKLRYYLFRDHFLTFLLLHRMEGAAVWLNKKVMHGRWHA